MESITKNRQPVEVLRRIVARAYGEAEVPDGEDFATELGEGYFNVAYRLDLRSGRQVVLKIAPPRGVEVMTCERGAMRTELAALELLRSRTSAPVPDVDFADTTHELVDADWFVMPLIEGDSLSALEESEEVSGEVTAGLRRDLGVLNRGINEVVGERFGPLLGNGFATWRECFVAMMEDILGDGERAGLDLGVEYDDVRAVLGVHLDALDEVTEPRLVEWDLWPGNVLVRDGRIVGLIDHERALWGDPLIEAGFNGMDLPDFGDPTPFIEGYGLDFVTPEMARRRWLYSIYLVLLMTIETHYRQYPDDGPYEWAKGLLADLMAE